jgi:GTPase SAR1 family protein
MITDTPPQDPTITTQMLTKQCFVFLVFDVTDKTTFANLDDFIDNFNHKNMNPNKLLYILGNKCDASSRQVTKEEAEEFA